MALALMLQELNAANFSSGAADSGAVLTADGSGGASWQAPGGGSALPYLVYTAFVTQSDEDDPEDVVLQNTLGGKVVWARGDWVPDENGVFFTAGVYTATLSGAFADDSKVVVFVSPHYVSEFSDVMVWQVADGDSIRFWNYDGAPVSGNLTDGSNASIEIRVYQ